MWNTKLGTALMLIGIGGCTASYFDHVPGPHQGHSHQKSICIVTQGSEPFQVNDVDLYLSEGFAEVMGKDKTSLVLLDGVVMLSPCPGGTRG